MAIVLLPAGMLWLMLALAGTVQAAGEVTDCSNQNELAVKMSGVSGQATLEEAQACALHRIMAGVQCRCNLVIGPTFCTLQQYVRVQNLSRGSLTGPDDRQ